MPIQPSAISVSKLELRLKTICNYSQMNDGTHILFVVCIYYNYKNKTVVFKPINLFLLNKSIHKNLFNVSALFWLEQQQSWFKSRNSDCHKSCQLWFNGCLPRARRLIFLLADSNFFSKIKSDSSNILCLDCLVSVFVKFVAYFTNEQQKYYYHELSWFFDVFRVDD